MRATLEPMHRCRPRPKPMCLLPWRARSTSFGLGKTLGSRLAIAHDSHSRSPSLNSVPASTQSCEIVLPSPGAGVEEAQDPLGGRVERAVAPGGRPSPLVGMLAEPLE